MNQLLYNVKLGNEELQTPGTFVQTSANERPPNRSIQVPSVGVLKPSTTSWFVFWVCQKTRIESELLQSPFSKPSLPVKTAKLSLRVEGLLMVVLSSFCSPTAAQLGSTLLWTTLRGFNPLCPIFQCFVHLQFSSFCNV